MTHAVSLSSSIAVSQSIHAAWLVRQALPYGLQSLWVLVHLGEIVAASIWHKILGFSRKDCQRFGTKSTLTNRLHRYVVGETVALRTNR